jgi:hypothetical protein
MSTRRFIKLGNTLLNTNSIRRVMIDPKEFQIELNPGGTTGFMMFGSGQFSADNDLIKVNKEKHSQSYKDLENWIQETVTTNTSN